MKRNTFAVLGLMAAGLIAAAPASANIFQVTPTQTQSYSVTTQTGGVETQTLDFNGFNSALGTLVGVTISFTLNETLNDNVENIGNTSVSVGTVTPLTATSTITVTAPVGNIAGTNVLTTAPFTGMVAPGETTVATTTVNTTVGPNTITSSLASYIGGINSVVVSVADLGSQNGDATGNVFNQFAFGSNGVVSLNYDYTVVPEPASVALMGLGLIGLAALRRRKS